LVLLLLVLQVVWTKEPYPEDAAMQYWFTKWVVCGSSNNSHPSCTARLLRCSSGYALSSYALRLPAPAALYQWTWRQFVWAGRRNIEVYSAWFLLAVLAKRARVAFILDGRQLLLGHEGLTACD